MNCIFCKIINGDIPSKKIYEDDICLVILDISQATKGHMLVIPKTHYQNIIECDEETNKHLFSIAKKMAQRTLDVLKADGVNILVNTNEVAGQSVFHFHIHVIPRYTNDDLTIKFVEHSDSDLEKIATKLHLK